MSISSAERAYQRFLLRFSYMGTRYRGVQRQQPRSSTAVDRTTVQSALESALDSILRLQLPASLVISSRTDSGVHAHANSGHVDLTPFPGRSVPRTFLRSLNKYLRKADHDIVVREAIPVPHWYHSRAMAERRRYVYRVGFLKNPENNEEFNTRLPLTCWRTSLMVNTAVDIEKVQQACELLQGCHDFKSFQSLTDQKTDPVRHMEEVTFVPDYDAGNLCPYSEDYTWWKFNITARSFLYKQVRRMVSAALYVGRGLIPLEQVSEMLDWSAPRLSSGRREIRLHLGDALFLTDIEYDPKLFKLGTPAPFWRPARPYLGKHGHITSRSALTMDDNLNADPSVNK